MTIFVFFLIDSLSGCVAVEKEGMLLRRQVKRKYIGRYIGRYIGLPMVVPERVALMYNSKFREIPLFCYSLMECGIALPVSGYNLYNMKCLLLACA